MPKKTPYQPKRAKSEKAKSEKNEQNFYETMGASMRYRQLDFAGPSLEGTPLWVYPAWIAGSIILGVLLGLAIKDFQTVKLVAARPGVVAKINDPQYDVATTGLEVSQSAPQPIQGNATAIQGNTLSLQPGQTITSYQGSFSAYGQQGSVGIPAAHQ